MYMNNQTLYVCIWIQFQLIKFQVNFRKTNFALYKPIFIAI